jgi:hypothetical protein
VCKMSDGTYFIETAKIKLLYKEIT